MDYIHTTKAGLGINLDIPPSKQNPLDKLNDLANKKRKHALTSMTNSKQTKGLSHQFSMKIIYQITIESNGGVVEVPSASALQVLRILGSIFTSVYAAVQKLKKDSWLELQFNLADNSKLNVGNVTSKVGIEVQQLSLKDGTWLPKKWLSFCQSLRNANHVKVYELAYLFGKLKYEESLIDIIYETDKSKSLISATPLSTAFLSTSIVQYFQDIPDDEEDTRSSHKYLNDLEEDYQARALLAKSKRFLKKGTQRFSNSKATDQIECHKKGHFTRDCWSNTSVPSYQSPFQSKLLLSSKNKLKPSSSSGKNKGLIAETYDWDDEEVSSDENEVTEVKALMALSDEERVSVGKESAINGDWAKISMKKHVNTEILKENQNLKFELLELTSITKTWLNSSNIVNQYINEQIPTQKKKIMGIDQLTKDTSSFESKETVFVKSLADNSDMPITNSNTHKSSETEDSTLPNQDTDEVPSNESQRNTTNPSFVFSDSSVTDYDSADESSVYSTPLLPLKKLDGVEPVSGPKTIKSILKLKSTFKAETLKAPAGKLKNVKMEDDPPLAIFRKRETLQAKNAESFKVSKNESSSALRSKTPTKRYQANPKESHLIVVKRIFRNLKDFDYAGCNMDRKSTSDACQFLGGKLVCWSAKKQQSVAISLAKAVYVVVARCCANILWMKSQLTDYDIIYEKVPIFDNTSAIAISNNPVLHLITKHIDIRYHFIRDHVLKGYIELHFIPTQYQLADIFTKPLDEPTFKRLIIELGMLNIDSKPEASILTEEN
ncbi:hypothetical protein Tco_0925473 [Tanacetum coccineum]|uniref:Retrovirus-related Pol polyprotein from transposon TNT 1-94 n=1 Tax=Tanacetum coccineum TaxID=301880 RepID=A0ABQ5DD28_9ASTR